MVSWLRRRIIRRSFRRKSQEVQTLLLEPSALGGDANDRAIVNAWCIALPILLFDVAFIKPAPSSVIRRALDRTALSEAEALFTGFVASCLAILLSVSKTAQGFDHKVACDFVGRVVGFLEHTSLKDIQTTGVLLDIESPTEWFTTTLWLRVFRESDAARSFYAASISGEGALLDAVGLRLLESALLENVSTVVGLLAANHLLDANAPATHVG